jgi:hypothetical protein
MHLQVGYPDSTIKHLEIISHIQKFTLQLHPTSSNIYKHVHALELTTAGKAAH